MDRRGRPIRPRQGVSGVAQQSGESVVLPPADPV
jgi:hypothetical protein